MLQEDVRVMGDRCTELSEIILGEVIRDHIADIFNQQIVRVVSNASTLLAILICEPRELVHRTSGGEGSGLSVK
jgi:hypothetical protein